jgi:hypothetical protein
VKHKTYQAGYRKERRIELNKTKNEKKKENTKYMAVGKRLVKRVK